jgi:predicted metal-dependent peptidase
MTAKEKLIKARAALVLDEPFFGSLVLRLKLKEDSSCETLWVDGSTLGFSPSFVDSVSMDVLKGCLCHEVLHCALTHHARRGSRDSRRWNIAADYAVNPIIKDKFSLPDGILFDPGFAELSVEDIYSRLPDDKGGDRSQGDSGAGGGSSDEGSQAEDDSGGGPDADPGGCGEVRDAGSGDEGAASGEADFSQAEADWKVAVAQATQQARAFGRLPAGVERLVDEVINPRVDWRAILRRFMDTAAKSDYSWVPPNRRHVYAGLYLPSCRNSELGPVVVAVDTSGSIGDEMLGRVAAELSAIFQDARAEVHVLYCDAKIQAVEYFPAADFPSKLNAKGGGGTDFRPVFDWIEGSGVIPSCIIYFSDLEGEFPDADPGFPVLWVVDGKAQRVPPFGEVLEVLGE